MQLFNLFRRAPRINDLDLDEVRRRVHGIREVNQPAESLADLFALVNETDVMHAPKRSFTGEPKQPERVMPDDIPSTGNYHQWER